MKSTQTWVLRYLLPSVHHKPVDAQTFRTADKAHVSLLQNGKIVTRELLPTDKLYSIRLMQPYKGKGRTIDGLENGKTYMEMIFEAGKEQNEGLLEFLKQHSEVTFLDANDREQNENVSRSSTPLYKLINLDARENELMDHTVSCTELIADIISVKDNSSEFSDLCYALGYNPSNTSVSAMFNKIVDRIKSDPASIKSMIHGDANKYYRMVLNKALMTLRGEDNYITESGDSFIFDGSVICSIGTGAGRLDGLIAYFKDNLQMFAFLENELGFKKKEPLISMETETPESSEPKRRGPKPKN